MKRRENKEITLRKIKEEDEMKRTKKYTRKDKRKIEKQGNT